MAGWWSTAWKIYGANCDRMWIYVAWMWCTSAARARQSLFLWIVSILDCRIVPLNFHRFIIRLRYSFLHIFIHNFHTIFVEDKLHAIVVCVTHISKMQPAHFSAFITSVSSLYRDYVMCAVLFATNPCIHNTHAHDSPFFFHITSNSRLWVGMCVYQHFSLAIGFCLLLHSLNGSYAYWFYVNAFFKMVWISIVTFDCINAVRARTKKIPLNSQSHFLSLFFPFFLSKLF